MMNPPTTPNMLVSKMSTCRYPWIVSSDVSLVWLSITLARSLCEVYTHLRLIIVYEETPGLEGLAIRNFALSSAHLRATAGSRQTPWHQTAQKASTPSNCLGTTPSLVLDVVLQLTFDDALLPRHRSPIKKSYLAMYDGNVVHQPLRIAYNSIYPISPTSNVLSLGFQDSHHWVDPDGPLFSKAFEAQQDNWYLLSIYPEDQHGQNRLASQLPPNVVRTIARWATLGRTTSPTLIPGWQSHLLCYASVCKAWRSAADVYWENIGMPNRRHILEEFDPSATLRSLDRKPHLKPYFRAIDDREWKFFNSEERFDIVKGVSSFQELLRAVGDHLNHLTISYDVFVNITKADFNTLQRLTHLCIRPYTTSWLSPRFTFFHLTSILELQYPLVRIESLRELNLRGGIKEVDHDDEPDLFSTVTEGPNGALPSFSLERLTIHSMCASSRQIHWLIHSPRLRRLCLKEVKGLTNSDLAEVFESVSQTLEELEVLCGSIQRPSEGEEFALDATIAKMKVLRSADVSWEIASELAIQRRVQNGEDDVKNPTIRFQTLASTPPRSKILPLSWPMQVTGWKCIELDVWLKAGRQNQMALFLGMRKEIRVATRIARKRGIYLEVDIY